MSPSKLRTWLEAHGEPIAIKDIAILHQKESGGFAANRIQRSMKALEAAELVAWKPGPHRSKLWYVVKSQKDSESAEPVAEVADTANGADSAASA